ncbi:MAG: 50S ribosomal protein L20 [Candidatus Eisenbacteria bacterium]|nr:50S ribosomal protein L20 [Candidatus Eisenbacteria bacterium]
MSRSRARVPSRERRRKILAKARGFQGSRGRLIKVANESVLRAGRFAYRDRRRRKRDFRSLWICRINAAARANGMSYSSLVHGLDAAGIQLDRKQLADLAVREPVTFARVVESAHTALVSARQG